METSYSFSIAFINVLLVILPPDFVIATIEAPPAPTPSFTNPFANACRPDLLDSPRCRSQDNIGTRFEAALTRPDRSDDGSFVMYVVVPIQRPFSDLPRRFNIATTADIWVPPASITLPFSDSTPLAIPATEDIIGSPRVDIASKGEFILPISARTLFSAESTTLFLRLCGFSGILLLTLNLASMPRALSTASAVVVPPGMLSPTTVRSDMMASCFPSSSPCSNVRITLEMSIAFSFIMFLPGSTPNDTYGIEGLTFAPPSTTRRGILANCNAVRVMSAGVGLPSGVAGTTSMHLQCPQYRNSASAGDVYFTSSAFAPATVSPEISLVAVYEITHTKTGVFVAKLLTASLSDAVMSSIYSLPVISSKNSCFDLGWSTELVFFSCPIVDVEVGP